MNMVCPSFIVPWKLGKELDRTIFVTDLDAAKHFVVHESSIQGVAVAEGPAWRDSAIYTLE